MLKSRGIRRPTFLCRPDAPIAGDNRTWKYGEERQREREREEVMEMEDGPRGLGVTSRRIRGGEFISVGEEDRREERRTRNLRKIEKIKTKNKTN